MRRQNPCQKAPWGPEGASTKKNENIVSNIFRNALVTLARCRLGRKIRNFSLEFFASWRKCEIRRNKNEGGLSAKSVLLVCYWLKNKNTQAYVFSQIIGTYLKKWQFSKMFFGVFAIFASFRNFLKNFLKFNTFLSN